jgi:glucosamine-6-phosphate deaminase
MKLVIDSDTKTLGQRAALLGTEHIAGAIEDRGSAAIVLATGASQFDVMAALCERRDIDWGKVTAFHLDEYIDLPEDHPASFRRYLRERFLAHIPTIGAFHFINGNAGDLTAELARMDSLIAANPIDVVFAGIGENGHLAFNDPPAEFTDKKGFKVVTLDQRCRVQQQGEGWFPTLEDVPDRAITMTVPQIMDCSQLIVSVSGKRKAEAVRDSLEGPITLNCPASMLQCHPACTVFSDDEATRALAPTTLKALS